MGEAYFEVAKDRSKKFIVESGDIVTEVLGTHFNVNTYSDETKKAVTLLEGSIKVSMNAESVMVKPGQQAVTDDKNIGINNVVDVNRVMAWKNGYFAFKNADIPTVMKQLSKWYDIDVKYENGIPDVLFSGEMQRKLSLAQVIDVLNTMGVHCTIRGKQLIIKP
jgi:ferric-dicitrate binding protein FerR (iron transport regulator)